MIIFHFKLQSNSSNPLCLWVRGCMGTWFQLAKFTNISGKSQTSLQQILGKSQANLRQILGKSRANLRGMSSKYQTNIIQILDNYQANLKISGNFQVHFLGLCMAPTFVRISGFGSGFRIFLAKCLDSVWILLKGPDFS